MGSAGASSSARIGHLAVTEAGARESSAGHFEFAHDDAQHCAEHLFFADGGVNLARGLKQRLEARHLLLQIDRFVIARQMDACCHNFFYLLLAGNLTLSRPVAEPSTAFLDGFYPIPQQFKNLNLIRSDYVASEG